MTDMKTRYLALLLCAGCAVAGCMRQRPTLDEEIEALPDEWGLSFNMCAASSNNYAMLNRVIAETNVQERIRLAWKLFNHFRHTPEWYVEHQDGGFSKRQRHDFFDSCAWRLMSGTNATPETIFAAWEMKAETIKDLEEIVRLTGPEWQEQMEKRHTLKIEEELRKYRERGGCISVYYEAHAPELNFAYEVRRRRDLFFVTFSGDGYYRRLPKEVRPAFIEQMKRDFFFRSGMTNVFMLKNFSPEMKAAYREVRDRQRMEQPSRQTQGKEDVAR